MKTAKTVATLLIAIIHAFAFLYAWSYFGLSINIATLSATDSLLCAALSASLACSALSTVPMSLLAGYVGGKSLAIPTMLLLLVAWAGLVLYDLGTVTKLPASTVRSLLSELTVMAIFGTVFFRLGVRLTLRGAAA